MWWRCVLFWIKILMMGVSLISPSISVFQPVMAEQVINIQPCTSCYNNYSLVPRPLPKEGRGPGIHCLRMRETTPGFYGGLYNSVPYRRLYLWTVRERPFDCLGVALRVRPPVVKVYILFSTAVVYARIALFCV